MNPYYNDPNLDMDQLIELLKRDPNYIDSEYSKKYEFLLEPSSESSTSGARRKVNKRVLEHLLKGANFHNNRLLEQLQQSSSKKLDQKTDDSRKRTNDGTTSRVIGKEKRKRLGLDMIQGILLEERNNRESQKKRTHGNDKKPLHLPSEKKQEEENQRYSNESIKSQKHDIECDNERRHHRSRTRSRSPKRHSSHSSRYDDKRNDRKRHRSSYDRESRHRESRSQRHEEHRSKEKYEKVEDFGLLQTKVRSRRHSEDHSDRVPQPVDSSTSRSRKREHSEECERSSRHLSCHHDKEHRDNKRDIKNEINKLIKSNDSTGNSSSSLFNRVDRPKSLKIGEKHSSNEKSEKKAADFNDLASHSYSKINKNHSACTISADTPIITKGRGSTSSAEVNKRFSEAYDPKKDFTTAKVTEIYGPSLEGAAPFQVCNSSGRTLANMLKSRPRTSGEKYSQKSSISWPTYSKGEREWDAGK
jgi:hypothetical protein